MELGRSLLVMATTNRCFSYVDLTRELWSRVDQKNKEKKTKEQVTVGLKHPRDNPPYIRYPRRTINSQIIFIFLSRSSEVEVPIKTKDQDG